MILPPAQWHIWSHISTNNRRLQSTQTVTVFNRTDKVHFPHVRFSPDVTLGAFSAALLPSVIFFFYNR